MATQQSESSERSRELADHPAMAAHCPRDLHPTSHHSRADRSLARENIARAVLQKPTPPCATSRAASRSSAIAWARATESELLLA